MYPRRQLSLRRYKVAQTNLTPQGSIQVIAVGTCLLSIPLSATIGRNGLQLLGSTILAPRKDAIDVLRSNRHNPTATCSTWYSRAQEIVTFYANANADAYAHAYSMTKI